MLTLFILGFSEPMTETLLVSVLGFLGSFLIQLIKKVSGVDGTTAFLITTVISVALGLGTVWLTGGLSLGAIPAILAVLGASTFVYQFIIKNLPDYKFPNETVVANNTTTTNDTTTTTGV